MAMYSVEEYILDAELSTTTFGNGIQCDDKCDRESSCSVLSILLQFNPGFTKEDIDHPDCGITSSSLHHAAEVGAYDCLREILSIDPALTKEVDDDECFARGGDKRTCFVYP
eukprot:PhF_6_TR28131/c3_g5_i3/m.41631